MTLPERVRVRMAKWDGSPHWTYETVVLGEDEHGLWLGSAVGTRFERPGASYLQTRPRVHLVGDDWCLPSFQAPGTPYGVYVDISTPPDLDDGELHAFDLDLDVVRGASGRTWVDDEDEFAAHRVALAYPPLVVAAATEACERVHAAVAARLPPYDGTAAAWLERLAHAGGPSSAGSSGR
ncbi:DUF402 domain-containing protein [uncultured Nocardioides sp.]|uniref:DUF402 domain-containing protein n=1 Tax=uncultured Nocardioides sp. TaxID=198441 RepID=UPI002635C98A|nr:DUF402 domain-containing protein [uncultured Nocardioides sp.]